MPDVQVKSDVESTGRQIERLLELLFRWLLRIAPPAIKTAINKFYNEHLLTGTKAVKQDGQTQEVEGATNLSYEETVEILERCQQDGVPCFAYEFKKGYKLDEEGNKITDNELGKSQSLSKMKSVTKASQKIKQYERLQTRNIPFTKKFCERKLDYWNATYERAIGKHEGARYNIVFNKSRAAYMADRLADIKSKRLGITKDDFYQTHPEAKEAIERAIDEGLDLNMEELGDWAREFVNQGNSDLSNFKDDYFVHTVSMEEYSKIYKNLDSNEFTYGVEMVQGKSKNDSHVNIYFHSEDINAYREYGQLDKGVLQSVGKKEGEAFDLNRTNAKKSKDIILPMSDMNRYVDMFKGRDFTINLDGADKDSFIVRMSLDDAKEVLDYEKKRNLPQEELDQIHQEKALNALENQVNEIKRAEEAKKKGKDKKHDLPSENRNDLQKAPSPVKYKDLSKDIRESLNKAYGFDDEKEAQNFFDNCTLEIGTNTKTSNMGIIVTTKDNDKEREDIVYFNEESRKRITDIQQNNNNNKSTPDTKSENTSKDKDTKDMNIDMDMEMDDK